MNCRSIAIISIAVLGLGLTACDRSEKSTGVVEPQMKGGGNGSKGGPNGPEVINPGADNPTIVGVDPSKLTGEVGEYARRQQLQAEVARQTQKWIRPPDLDLGECRVNGVTKGTFSFTNPTSETQYIRAVRKSCTCQKVVLRFGAKEIEVSGMLNDKLPIPAGAKGEIDVYLKIDSLGKKLTEVVVETTDPETPVIQVRASGIGIQEFLTEFEGQITSSVYFSGVLTSRTQRDFEVRVRSKSKKPFKITGHGPLPLGLKLGYEPAEGHETDGLEWVISGQFGPGLPEGGAGGEVEFKTDRGGGFSLQFHAFVSPPITMEPAGALSFSRIQAHKGATQEIRLTATHEDDTFTVASVEVVEARIAGKKIDGASLGFKVDKVNPRLTKIAVTVPPKMPDGMLQGRLRIHFKEDGFNARELTFFGFIRA